MNVCELSTRRCCFVLLQHSFLTNSCYGICHLIEKAKSPSTTLSVWNRCFLVYLIRQRRKGLKHWPWLWSALQMYGVHATFLLFTLETFSQVGKSSLINSLYRKPTLPIYTVVSSSKGPTTTELPQEVSLNVNGATITFIDSPGLSFVPEDDFDSLQHQNRARDILLRCKGRIDRLKDPVLPSTSIGTTTKHPALNLFIFPVRQIVSRANTEDLMLLYSLPAFPQGDCAAFLSGVARAQQLVKKVSH